MSQCLNLHTCSDWMTDPLLPKKVKIVKLFDGAFSGRIHNALRVRPHSKSMGISQRTEVVGTRRKRASPSRSESGGAGP